MNDMLVYLILGLVVSFNFLVVLRKFRLSRFTDACIDISLCMFLSFLFSGSYAGLVVANFASFLISLYLFKNPVTIQGFLIKKEEKRKKLIKKNTGVTLPITPITIHTFNRYC